MGKHDDALLARIRGVVSPMVLNGGLTEGVQEAASIAAGSNDVVRAMRALAELIFATEGGLAAAKAADAAARAILLEAMQDTGCSKLDLTFHTVSLVDGRDSFAVTDPAAIPPALMRQPPPEPDRNAIQRLLSARQSVPGVVPKNGAPHLRITANKG